MTPPRKAPSKPSATPDAARTAHRRNSTRVLGLPLTVAAGGEQLAFLAGVGALVVIGVVEWPIAAVLGVGHILAGQRNHKLLADFGEALEDV